MLSDYLPLILILGYATAVALGLMANRLGTRYIEQKPKLAKASDEQRAAITRLFIYKRITTYLFNTMWIATTAIWWGSTMAPQERPTFFAIVIVIPIMLVCVLALVRWQRKRAGTFTVPRFFLYTAAVAAVMAVLGLWVHLTANPLLYLTGAATKVELHITDVGRDHYRHENRDVKHSHHVSGFYDLRGERHTVTESDWSTGWRDIPKVGDTVDVSIGPIWPHTMFEHPIAAFIMLTLGVGLLLVATFAAWVVKILVVDSDGSVAQTERGHPSPRVE